MPLTSPTLAQVGALLRARTKDNLNNEVGTFNEDTRPTGDQVTSLTGDAFSAVGARVGFDFDDAIADEDLLERLNAAATNLIALRTAMMVELSHFPEQVNTDRSPYEKYKELYDEAVPLFEQALQEAASGEDSGAVDDARLARHTFPLDEGGLIGWGTKF